MSNASHPRLALPSSLPFFLPTVQRPYKLPYLNRNLFNVTTLNSLDFIENSLFHVFLYVVDKAEKF